MTTNPDGSDKASKRFDAHLKEATQRVASWPEWKQQLLGPSPVGADRSGVASRSGSQVVEERATDRG